MLLDLERHFDALLVLLRPDFDDGQRFIPKKPVEFTQFLFDAQLQLVANFHAFAVDVDLHDDRSLLIMESFQGTAHVLDSLYRMRRPVVYLPALFTEF
jgi:hypothetical protein